MNEQVGTIKKTKKKQKNEGQKEKEKKNKNIVTYALDEEVT